MDWYDGDFLTNYGKIIEMSADRYSKKTALMYKDDEITYEELEHRANRFANVLNDLGVAENAHVAIQMGNKPQFMEVFWGTLKSGRVPVPLNLRLPPKTLSYILENSDSVILVADEEKSDSAEGLFDSADNLEWLVTKGEPGHSYEKLMEESDDEHETVPAEKDDLAMLLYTSGTTGKPKGVMLSHENLLTNVDAYNAAGLSDSEMVMLGVMPWYHSYGLIMAGTMFYTGGCVVAQNSIEPEDILQSIEKWEINIFPGISTLFKLILLEYQANPEKYDLSSMDYIFTAAEPLPSDTKEKLEEIFGEAIIVEADGLTEMGPVNTAEPLWGKKKEGGCIGPTLKNIEGKVVDPEDRSKELDVGGEGELAWGGPAVAKGYYKKPEKAEEAFQDGWVYTGDVGYVDEDGYYWFTGRTDDMIKSAGEKIHPPAVEDALANHSAVSEAAVVSAPHKVKGEVPVAFVVKSGDVSEEELKEFSLEHVPTYAHPRRIFFQDSLPKSGTLKTQRYKLREKVDDLISEPLG